MMKGTNSQNMSLFVAFAGASREIIYQVGWLYNRVKIKKWMLCWNYAKKYNLFNKKSFKEVDKF